MTAQGFDVLSACRHDLLYDEESEMVTCARCGLVAETSRSVRQKRVPEGSGLNSPGMIHGLGTDQRQLIREFHKLGLKKEGAERPDGFMLSLRGLWDGGEDVFWIRLTQALKDRGIKEEKIAIACAALRREVRHLNDRKSEELLAILRRFGVE